MVGSWLPWSSAFHWSFLKSFRPTPLNFSPQFINTDEPDLVSLQTEWCQLDQWPTFPSHSDGEGSLKEGTYILMQDSRHLLRSSDIFHTLSITGSVCFNDAFRHLPVALWLEPLILWCWEETTSKDQKAMSLSMLGCHKLVILATTLLAPIPLYGLKQAFKTVVCDIWRYLQPQMIFTNQRQTIYCSSGPEKTASHRFLYVLMMWFWQTPVCKVQSNF